MRRYRVRQGDSTSSIAYKFGLFWETIWQHPDNAELAERRDNPNVLFPGDIIYIPEKEEKEIEVETEQRHRFRRKGIPEKLRIRLLDERDEPRPDVAYTFIIDGEIFRGTTNGEGLLEHGVLPDAQEGRLQIDGADEEYRIQIGYLDPANEISGIQERLRNLGIYEVDITGEMDEETIFAIREFQREKELEVSGELDDETLRELETLHVA